MHLERATFGAGCFWGVEARFRQIDGVVDTAVGFSGGTVVAPTYKQVCRGGTGHTEVVQVDFDPGQVSYDTLLRALWDSHDPTRGNRSAWRQGVQYRSVIFFHSEAQERAAREARTRLEQSGQYERPIATAIEPAGPFYPAEAYHQQYYEKRGQTSCAASVRPVERTEP